jgi:mono/diheme cytochrome c family protein
MNLIELIALIGVAALLIRFAIGTSRIKKPLVKWSALTVSVLLAGVASIVSALALTGLVKAHSRSAPIRSVIVEMSPEKIARGKAVADSFCSGCHSVKGTLTGGMDLGNDLPVPVGSFVSSNLTPAGRLKRWSDGEIFRAIRNGIDADGHWLTFMSYTNAGKLSDDDTRAVIAYIRSVPAAGPQQPDPPDRFNLLGLTMLGAGLLPSGNPVTAAAVTAPPKGPTQQFGEYILSYQDCRVCHGQQLTGGVPGQLGPLGPDLNVVKGWNREEFIATLRSGVDPNGHELGQNMPWRPLGRMDDEELSAVYEYLTHLPSG